MKRITISVLLVVTFAAYAAYVNLFNKQTAIITQAPIRQTNSLPVQPKQTAQKPAPSQNNGQYKNGEYTGNVEDAFYGNVQVKIIISSGKISSVQFLDYPQDRQTSVYINSQAMPYLKQEAIQAQSANVDIISGATATSQAFIQSLASALAQAV